MTEHRIQLYLNTIKQEGKSSPAGKYWDGFFKFLKSLKKPHESSPPVPLILAASVESAASKHSRLSEQLEWAMEHGCLNESIEFLSNLEIDKWNICSEEKWHKSYG